VTQGEQVDPDIDTQAWGQGGRRGGLDESVHSEASMKAHVVGHEDVVKSALFGSGQEGAAPRVGSREHLGVSQGSDAQDGRVLHRPDPSILAV
jgi:hypothetical protein